jgi:hypothetical protein
VCYLSLKRLEGCGSNRFHGIRETDGRLAGFGVPIDFFAELQNGLEITF